MRIRDNEQDAMVDLGAASKITKDGDEGGIEFIALMPQAGLSPNDLRRPSGSDTPKTARYNRIINFL